MKKVLKVLSILSICALLCCGTVALAINVHGDLYTGYANTECTIYFEMLDGVLDITRNPKATAGESISKKTMDDFEIDEEYSKAPWQLYKKDNITHIDIKTINIGEGIAVIGKNAFRGQTQIETVTLPASLTAINEGAFENTVVGKINYYGTEEQWDALTVGSKNGIFNKTYAELKAENKINDVNNLMGDVNLDGKVNKSDAVLIAECIAANKQFKSIKVSAADVTGDGKIDVCDCVMIMKMSAK